MSILNQIDMTDYEARAKRIRRARATASDDHRAEILYYTITVTDENGKTWYCVSVSGPADSPNLEFVDAKNPFAWFGGYKFKSEKQAWWHWYRYLEKHPDVTGKPEVNMYEA